MGWVLIVNFVRSAPGADPENVEPGGANSTSYQTEPGGAT